MKKIHSGTLVLVSLLLLVSSGVVIAYAELTPPIPDAPTYDVSVEEANAMLAENQEQIILLDVRSEGEFSTEYIPGAINIPTGELENRLDELDMSKEIIVYCKSGGRSSAAKDMLVQHEFIVYNMLGGINAWKGKFDTSTSASTPATSPASAVTPSPSGVSPTPTASPITSPVTTPGVGGTPGFELTVAIAAIAMLAWCLLRKSRKS